MEKKNKSLTYAVTNMENIEKPFIAIIVSSNSQLLKVVTERRAKGFLKSTWTWNIYFGCHSISLKLFPIAIVLSVCC